MSFSDYLENKILDHVFKNSSFTQPVNLYVALFTVAPTDTGGGTEVSGGGYARINHNGWNVAAAGATANTTEVLFAQATANWGTVTHVGIFDASTAGNLIAWGALMTSKAINNGDQARFAAGDIDITLD